MATHSSILAWKTPWTEEPGGLQPEVTRSRTQLSAGNRRNLGKARGDTSVNGIGSGGQPFPSPGALPDPGAEPRSPILEADSSPSEPSGKPITGIRIQKKLESSFQRIGAWEIPQ